MRLGAVRTTLFMHRLRELWVRHGAELRGLVGIHFTFLIISLVCLLLLYISVDQKQTSFYVAGTVDNYYTIKDQVTLWKEKK